jgi:hypothetical protein
MKYKPLTKKDFTDTTSYNALMPAGTGIDRQLHNNLPKKRSYATILNELGCHLFLDFDCFNITKQQLTELNRLIKLGMQIMNTYIPKDEQQNINLVTFPVYLFRATREFCITHVSKDFLAGARKDEDSNYYGKQLKYGPRIFLHSDICCDYMPRQVKSKMREEFKQEYGVYPENIYIAVVFYLMPYVLGIRSAHPTCDNGLLRMVLNNINPTLHNQQCGTAQKKSWKNYADGLFEFFEQDMLSGKYRGQSAIAIKFSIQASHKLRDSIVSRFNKKYNLKRIIDFYKPKN